MFATNQKMLDVALATSIVTTMTVIRAIANCSNTLDGKRRGWNKNETFSGGNQNKFSSREECSETCLRTVSQPQVPSLGQDFSQPGD